MPKLLLLTFINCKFTLLVSMYNNVTVSDSSNDRSFRPVRVTAYSTSLAAVPVCLESGSTRFSPFTAVTIRLSVAVFTDGAVNISFRLADTCHI